MTAPQPNMVVSARDLSIEYRSNSAQSRHLAVRGVSFDLHSGDVLGILGESGAGKSTLATAIAGMAGGGHRGDGTPQICGGQLEVYGMRLRHLSAQNRDRLTLRVGFLRQDGGERLSPMLTIAENVAEPIYRRDRRFDTREAADAVATAIDAVRLPLGLMNKLPFELSSGQRQRVALAQALILEPTLLVADEPTRGVDSTVRDGLLEALTELRVEREISAIIVSSDLAVITRFARTAAVMQNGIFIGFGEIEDLLTDSDEPYVKQLARTRYGSTFSHGA